MTKAPADVFPLTLFLCPGLHLDYFVQRWQISDFFFFFYPQFPPSFLSGLSNQEGRFNFTFRPHIQIWLFQTQHYFFFPSWSPIWLVELCALLAKAKREEEKERELYLRLYIEYQYKTEYLPEKLVLRKLKVQLELEGGMDNSLWEIDDGIVLFCFLFIILFSDLSPNSSSLQF